MSGLDERRDSEQSVPTKPVTPVERMTRRLAMNRAKVADVDAELNGGALVEVGIIAGKPLYIRVNHYDPDVAKYETELVTTILKGAFYDPVDFEADKPVSGLVAADASPKYRLSNPQRKEPDDQQ